MTARHPELDEQHAMALDGWLRGTCLNEHDGHCCHEPARHAGPHFCGARDCRESWPA